MGPAELRTGTSILARLRAELDVARQELANALRKVARLEAEIAEARATAERLYLIAGFVGASLLIWIVRALRGRTA